MSEKPATDGTTAQDLIFSQDGIVLDGPKLLRVAVASMTAITSQNFTEGEPDPALPCSFSEDLMTTSSSPASGVASPECSGGRQTPTPPRTYLREKPRSSSTVVR